MLNSLEYTSSARCKAPPEIKSQAEKALKVYKSLEKDKKHDYLQKYVASKGDLSFVKEFQDKTDDFDESADQFVEGYMNANEILKLNAFDASTMEQDEIDELRADLINQSEEV